MVRRSLLSMLALLLAACPPPEFDSLFDPTRAEFYPLAIFLDLYGVGGTVNGLSGGTLMLQNNGTDDFPVNASGAFTMPTRLPGDSAYRVSILSQPEGHACVVSGGSGFLAYRDIETVEVSCSPYRLGGAVSGLAGSGLVIQNNNRDNLAIESDGSYSFPLPPAEGENYRVSILTQPKAPWQNCTIANSRGVMGAQGASNLDIACVTNTYSVGGTVGGLAGTGLVLSTS